MTKHQDNARRAYREKMEADVRQIYGRARLRRFQRQADREEMPDVLYNKIVTVQKHVVRSHQYLAKHGLNHSPTVAGIAA